MCFVLVLAFWAFTILGVVDTDTFEPSLDLDADVDADAEIEGSSVGMGLLKFFNVGEVPIMVLLSVLMALLWAGSVLGNYHLNAGGSYLIAFGLFLGNAFAGLFLTKILTTPLKPLMRKLKAGEKHRPVVGRVCVIKTSEVTETFGQAEAEDDSGNPLLLHVRVSEGSPSLTKGDRALVVDTHDDAQTYLVRKFES